MKKIISAILAVTLFLSFACSALAEGNLAPLLETVRSLLFSTENVTLSGEAVFSLDGERFKTAEILYRQAGEDSHWQLDLKTPRQYRRDKETGFTIIANGEKIFVMERYWPGTYSSGSDQPNSTLLRQSTRADLLFSMLQAVSDQAEALLPENAFTVRETEDGREILISMSRDTTPALVNTSLNLVADFLLRRFMGVNYDSIRNWGQGSPADYITVTQAVLYSTDSFVLGDTSVTVTEDSAGRITAVSGTVTALLSSEEFSGTPLVIDFTLNVSDYGITEVQTFAPEDFDVVPKGSDLQPEKEVEPALADKMTACAKEHLSAAGYDISALPASALVNEQDGVYYVNFLGDTYAETITAGLNDNGDLLTLSDNSNEYYLASPREPKNDSLTAEAVEILDTFMHHAFPELAANVKYYILGLEYEYEGVTWQYVTPLNSDDADTGIVLILRTVPSLQVVWYSCLN